MFVVSGFSTKMYSNRFSKNRLLNNAALGYAATFFGRKKWREAWNAAGHHNDGNPLVAV